MSTPQFPLCETLRVDGERCSNIALVGLSVCHVHDPARQCGYAKPDGTVCRVATGGRGYCRRHDGVSQPVPKPKRRPLQSELLGPAAWGALPGSSFVLPYVPRKSARAYYRRLAEQLEGERQIASTVHRMRNAEMYHRLQFPPEDPSQSPSALT